MTEPRKIIVALHETKHGVDAYLFATQEQCEKWEKANVTGEWMDEYFNWDWKEVPE